MLLSLSRRASHYGPLQATRAAIGTSEASSLASAPSLSLQVMESITQAN